jgi:hypothetical protein
MMDKTSLDLTACVTVATFFKLWGLYRSHYWIGKGQLSHLSGPVDGKNQIQLYYNVMAEVHKTWLMGSF